MDGQAFFSVSGGNFHQSGWMSRYIASPKSVVEFLAMIERIMYAFISRQQQRRNFAVPTGPVEQDFLLLVCQVIWGVGFVYIVVHTAGWITEEKALE
ncbi:MAG: hypothetical protein ACYS3S_07365 [Planctomycetota bacterium]